MTKKGDITEAWSEEIPSLEDYFVSNEDLRKLVEEMRTDRNVSMKQLMWADKLDALIKRGE